MANTVFDQIFRDGEGKIVLVQMPNLPLITWLLASILQLIFTTGKTNVGLEFLSFGAIFTWAWEELFQGVNYFRRVLGLFVIIILILGKVQ